MDTAIDTDRRTRTNKIRHYPQIRAHSKASRRAAKHSRPTARASCEGASPSKWRIKSVLIPQRTGAFFDSVRYAQRPRAPTQPQYEAARRARAGVARRKHAPPVQPAHTGAQHMAKTLPVFHRLVRVAKPASTIAPYGRHRVQVAP